MLEFYRVDVIIIIIIVTISFLVYNTVDMINEDIKKIDKMYKLLFSFIIGFVISILYSFFTLEKDVLLTDNYWD
jgi:hypothetical protein